MTNAAPLVSGLIVSGYLVIAVYFLRFWTQARDSLFGFFSAAFFLLATQRLLLTLLPQDEGTWIFLYGLRALAFVLIIYAFLIKNRKP